MFALYTYFRSSAAYRVRIGLHLKGLSFESIPIHLLRDGGQQHSEAYKTVNAAGLVPTFQDGDLTLHQSLAILEYLDETHPQSPFLPGNAAQRAFIRSLALDIACEIHPLNNLRVLKQLASQFQADDTIKRAWINHWVSEGFTAFERRIKGSAGWCCVGDEPTLADIVLVPQVFNAERFGVDLKPYPTIQKVVAHCRAIEAFQLSEPSKQPDAE